MPNYGPTFPEASDDGCEPFRAIGAYLNCSEFEVASAFAGLRAPEWSTPEAKSNQEKSSRALNKCTAELEKLIKAYSALSDEDYQLAIEAGGITRPQLRATKEIFASHSASMSRCYGEDGRKGGRNIAAYTVAEGIRRLFRRKRRPIGWGITEGYPSTPFGRAVEFSLGEFGVISGWRGATEAAYKKQKKMEGRLMAIHLSRKQTPFEEK